MYEIDNNKTKQISKTIEKLRKTNPLTHCITNYVTINDCANAVLAIGASPAMANEEEEIEEFVQIAQSTIINLGNLLNDQIPTITKASQETKKTQTPLILDPVEVGVSKLRNDITRKVIDQSEVNIIRSNMSEIKAIGKLYGILDETITAKGVDAAADNKITWDNIEENAQIIE